MKYDLGKILRKLESNTVPRSMRRMDLNRERARTMAELRYEIASTGEPKAYASDLRDKNAAEPKVIRPEFIQAMFDGELFKA